MKSFISIERILTLSRGRNPHFKARDYLNTMLNSGQAYSKVPPLPQIRTHHKGINLSAMLPSDNEDSFSPPNSVQYKKKERDSMSKDMEAIENEIHKIQKEISQIEENDEGPKEELTSYKKVTQLQNIQPRKHNFSKKVASFRSNMSRTIEDAPSEGSSFYDAFYKESLQPIAENRGSYNNQISKDSFSKSNNKSPVKSKRNKPTLHFLAKGIIVK